MTRTLLLIRHCKSDWDAGAASDHDRPLNERGRQAAPRIGAYLKSEGLTPDEVLCSDAVRTAETWTRIAAQLDNAPEARLSRALYLAEPAAMMQALRQARGDCVALIGHCPGILSLAWDLAETPASDPEFGTYPTGALTVLEFGAESWALITTGRIRTFVTPRRLPSV